MISLVVFFLQVYMTVSWQPPSYISPWETISTSDLSNLEKTINHTLGEYPAKVDVQIKIVVNGSDYIFTGTGSALRDDDDCHDYGAVVYFYDSVNVYISYPDLAGGRYGCTDSSICHGVAYTGSADDYKGPPFLQGCYVSGMARIRAWRESALSTALFTLSIEINDRFSGCFQERTLSDNKLPDIVVAQAYFNYSGKTYISEAQGNIFQHDHGVWYNILAGIVVGYDKQKVRLWTPEGESRSGFTSGNPFNGAVVAFDDGWGTHDIIVDSAIVVVRGYKLNKGLQTEFEAGKGVVSSDTISFGSSYNLDNDLVIVQVREDRNSGQPNAGMIFSGAGSAQSTGRIYSGVVYAYTNDSAYLYTPSDTSTSGHMVYIGNRWGNGQSPSMETTASIIVTVFSGTEDCPEPKGVTGATYNVTSLKSGGELFYTCDPGFVHETGDLNMTCDVTKWNGTTPSCKELRCQDPSVDNTTHSTTDGYKIGSVLQYSCIAGYIYTSGYLTRTCQTNEQWDGSPPVCSVKPCADPGSAYNANYLLSGLYLSDKATYTCDNGTTQQAGDAVRTCQADGSWSGIPIVCSTPCLVTSPPVVYTPETLQESIEKIKDELTVDETETNAYVRAHTSAKDPRPSSAAIGSIGVVLLCLLVAALVIPDLFTFYNHFKHYETIYHIEKRTN